MSTQKMNETFIKEILKNESTESAIIKIAEALSKRDEIIEKLRKV